MTLVDAHMLGLVGQTPVGPADPVLRKGLALNRKQPLHQEVDCSHSVGTTLMQPLNELLLELHSTDGVLDRGYHKLASKTPSTSQWHFISTNIQGACAKVAAGMCQRLVPECAWAVSGTDLRFCRSLILEAPKQQNILHHTSVQQQEMYEIFCQRMCNVYNEAVSPIGLDSVVD